MGTHKCDKCGITHECLLEDCDYDGQPYTCEMCFCKANDVDPRTHVKKEGAFQKFLDETGGDRKTMLGSQMREIRKLTEVARQCLSE